MKINSIIYRLHENGTIEEAAGYSLPSFEAIVCYYEQSVKHNQDTWNYKHVSTYPGIKETKSGNYTFTHEECTYTAIQQEEKADEKK